MNVNKTAKYIGQYVEFSYEVPLRGLVTITSFSDVIINQTGSRFFDKEFKYTMDGARYSDWQPLTLLNLQAINGGTLPIENDFILAFRYIRAGSDNTDDLTVQSFLLNGTYSLAYLQVLDLSNTIFEDIGFTDEYWNKVWINLLDKLYKRGIVPKFILRGDDNVEDRDYIDFWKTIAYFYALTIALLDDKITNLINRQDDLSEFLLERGVFVCGDSSLITLNYVASNIYDQIRRRATQGITYIDGTHLAPVADPVHGELLRLICFDIVNDEFLFEYIRHNGWYLNVWSPTYHGLYNNAQLNKTPDNFQDIGSLVNYNVSGTVNLVADGTKGSVAEVAPTSSLGLYEMKVDDKIAYEFTFLFKYVGVDPAAITVRCDTKTALGTPLFTFSIQTGTPLNTFISGYTPPNNTVYYLFRGIIHSRNESLQTNMNDYQTNLNFGRNLKFRGGAQRIEFTIENNGLSNLYVWDVKFRPLKETLNNVFLNSTDLTRTWTKNRNFEISSKINPFKDITIEEVLDIKIREGLIPMGSALIRKSL